jgi:hypothetical protein
MTDYIGYKENSKIGFGEATLVTGGAALPITAIIDIAVAAIPFIISLIGKKGKPNPNDWQGRTKEQVERNYKVFGRSIVIVLIFGLILYLYDKI